MSSRKARPKPTSGDISNDLPTLQAWLQSTAALALPAFIIWFMTPTPMIEPISVCELDDGKPKYHVPRFQTIAASSSANTMANPTDDPALSTSPIGSSCNTV